MGKRLFCLIFAAVLLVSCTFGTKVMASDWAANRTEAEKHLTTVRAKSNHRISPLVSAMFLILAGMGVSLLFDKKEDP